MQMKHKPLLSIFKTSNNDVKPGLVKFYRQFIVLSAALLIAVAGLAQTDTARSSNLDSFILRQKGFIGELARNLLSNNPGENESRAVQRNDAAFKAYRGLIVRRIIIQPVNFGKNIGDTSKGLNNKITRLLDRAHRTTKEEVIRRNLFFHEGDVLSPYLMGASERHLRDLVYLQEAKIHVIRVWNSSDSVDVVVFSKDAFSLGGGINFMEATRFELKLQEDNFWGRGDRALISGFYDVKRRNPLGYGAEYAMRNIKGSFVDGYAGFNSYESSFSTGKHDECHTYIRFIKPLVNPFMKWTYALEASHHQTKNLYFPDSIYHADQRYRYDLFDGWAGWNFTADKPVEGNREDRLNWLVGGRLLQRHFIDRPQMSGGKYFYRYTNLSAVLGAISLFQQTFYKTQYIYGFGRNEDVPEGLDASLTGGWTSTGGVERPYVGI
ncbi:MAG: hypothetical protein JWP88_1480, partial [Flaviaesturariibacter sp.]|nr:hypothetical protein [Flaviaesturariibacter sp.]